MGLRKAEPAEEAGIGEHHRPRDAGAAWAGEEELDLAQAKVGEAGDRADGVILR